MISREGPGLSLSKKHLQADIDFVTAPLPHITETTLKDKVQVGKLLSEQLLAEAEIIKIVTEVLQSLKISETEHKLEVRLGHACILHACLEQIHTSAELLSSVLQNISTVKRLSPCGPTRSENWLSIQPALEDLGLSSSEIRNWKRFVTKLSGECRSALPQLISALSNNGQNPLHAPLALAFEEIKSLMSLLEAWKLGTEQIVMDPILFPEADYYSGIYFEVHLVHLTKKSSSEVAIGGRSDDADLQLVHWTGSCRYDRLLATVLKQRSRNPPTIAGRYGVVGATLNLNLFVRKEMDTHQRQHPLRTTSSDVLVCAKIGGAASLEV